MSSEETNKEERYYPNKWARIIFTSAEEIAGKQGLAALLNLAGMSEYIDNYPPDDMKKEFPFEKVGRLQQAFWDMYGNRGARVFATRAGEQSFKDGLQSFGSVAKAAQAAMAIGSVEKRISVGLAFFAKFFNTVSDQVVSVDEDEKSWYWNLIKCPMCTGRKEDSPVCYLAVGVLRAATTWASNGHQFRITPIKCQAMGDEIGVIEIEKEPIR
ncbi:MAG: 4-vinyl reductase [Chloroflexi bacterium]|nr:MAG: 4-vinyl reductase [Chloroflexota bacterium]